MRSSENNRRDAFLKHQLMTAPLWTPNYIKSWTCNFLIFFSFMIVTPLLPLYLSESFGADKHVIGIVLSGYTLMALLSRSVAGYIVDTLPRRMVLVVSWITFSVLYAGYFATFSLAMFAVVRTLHGVPFATTCVSNATVAIDVTDSTRRAEGIGLYGLSNNLATAIAPMVGLYIYQLYNSFELLFGIALGTALLGVLLSANISLRKRELVTHKQPISLDRFFLKNGLWLGVCMAFFAMSYGVLATYLAIFCKEEMGNASASGNFFLILALGLICSRLVGAKSLRKGRIVENANFGVLFSVLGYGAFALFHNLWSCYACAIIVGLGNGHMFPAFNNMFVNLAPASQRGTANATLLTMWDVGMGLGIVLGGIFAEYFGYVWAFGLSATSQIMGVIVYFAIARSRYIRQKLV